MYTSQVIIHFQLTLGLSLFFLATNLANESNATKPATKSPHHFYINLKVDGSRGDEPFLDLVIELVATNNPKIVRTFLPSNNFPFCVVILLRIRTRIAIINAPFNKGTMALGTRGNKTMKSTQ